MSHRLYTLPFSLNKGTTMTLTIKTSTTSLVANTAGLAAVAATATYVGASCYPDVTMKELQPTILKVVLGATAITAVARFAKACGQPKTPPQQTPPAQQPQTQRKISHAPLILTTGAIAGVCAAAYFRSKLST